VNATQHRCFGRRGYFRKWTLYQFNGISPSLELGISLSTIVAIRSVPLLAIAHRHADGVLERFQAKACPALDPGRLPVRVKKARQNKETEPRFWSIRTEALS
jgi:hypothetical protein